jgi:hypothetical protein
MELYTQPLKANLAVPALGRWMRGNAHMMEACKNVICDWLHFARQGCSWPPGISDASMA